MKKQLVLLLMLLPRLAFATSIPATSIPATSIPATSIPATSIPATSIPALKVPGPISSIPKKVVPKKARASVVVYTRDGCSGCRTLLGYLRSHNIPYRECNISRSGSCMQHLLRSGYMELTPITEVRGQVVYGAQGSKIGRLSR